MRLTIFSTFFCLASLLHISSSRQNNFRWTHPITSIHRNPNDIYIIHSSINHQHLPQPFSFSSFSLGQFHNGKNTLSKETIQPNESINFFTPNYTPYEPAATLGQFEEYKKYLKEEIENLAKEK